jgi:hypothetical protein
MGLALPKGVKKNSIWNSKVPPKAVQVSGVGCQLAGLKIQVKRTGIATNFPHPG